MTPDPAASNADALKQCPFCGGRPVDASYDFTPKIRYNVIECGSCGSATRVSNTFISACSLWDTRFQPAPSGLAAEKLTEALEWIVLNPAAHPGNVHAVACGGLAAYRSATGEG